MDSINQKNDPAILKTLDKGIIVLLHLLEVNNSISVTELSKNLSINKSTIFKILKTLEGRGLVYQFENEKYGLRIEMFQMIVDQYDLNPSLQRIARNEIERLSTKCHETVTLSSLVESNVQCIDKIDSSVTVHITHKVGRFSPLYTGATGKAILAYYSDSDFKKYIQSISLKPLTDYTLTSVEDLLIDLKEIKKRGFAYSHGELDLGVSGVAAPIFQTNEKVVGAVSIWGLTQSISHEKLMEYGECVKKSALNISENFRV